MGENESKEIGWELQLFTLKGGHSSTRQAVRNAQRQWANSMERKRGAVARQKELSCLLTALVMAFSMQEGFGGLSSCFVNTRSTCLWRYCSFY